MVVRGEWDARMSEKVKADVVTNSVISLRGTDGYQTQWGEHIVKYINVESLHRASETNIILYAC